MLMGDFNSAFWPCTAREGMALYWIKCIEAFTRFVVPNSEDPTIFATLALIPARDPFLWVIKNFEGPTVLVDEERRQVEVTPT